MTDAPFYYTSKASKSERNLGCEDMYWKFKGDHVVLIDEDEYNSLKSQDVRVAAGNCHPTVKPIEIMEWLVERLSGPGDTILDPFAGSGTTGIAAMRCGRSCKLVELNEDGSYEHIIKGRLKGQRDLFLSELPVWESRPKVSLPDGDEGGDEEVLVLGDLLGW